MSNILSRSVEDKQTVAVSPEITAPTATAETHINAFKQDVEDALTQAHAILNEVELKYKALLNKLGI